jgi:hypothetical protein
MCCATVRKMEEECKDHDQELKTIIPASCHNSTPKERVLAYKCVLRFIFDLRLSFFFYTRLDMKRFEVQGFFRNCARHNSSPPMPPCPSPRTPFDSTCNGSSIPISLNLFSFAQNRVSIQKSPSELAMARVPRRRARATFTRTGIIAIFPLQIAQNLGKQAYLGETLKFSKIR